MHRGATSPRFVDISEAFTYGTGSPQLGASIVRLTQ